MTSPLDPLLHKVERLLDVCDRLGTENSVLREHIERLEADNLTLKSRIDQSCARLEVLLENLPE